MCIMVSVKKNECKSISFNDDGDVDEQPKLVSMVVACCLCRWMRFIHTYSDMIFRSYLYLCDIGPN